MEATSLAAARTTDPRHAREKMLADLRIERRRRGKAWAFSGFGRLERDRGVRPASSLQRMRSISTTNYTHGRHGGHAPGHICDAFIAAIDAFEAWKDGEPEPTVEHEVHNQPVEITISQACGLVWNCSDILPNLVVRQLEDCDVTLTRVTCAAGARACASGSRSFCLRGPLSGNRPFRLCGFRRLGLGRQPRADLGEIGWCERPSSRCERGPALDAQHSARWTATLPAALALLAQICRVRRNQEDRTAPCTLPLCQRVRRLCHGEARSRLRVRTLAHRPVAPGTG